MRTKKAKIETGLITTTIEDLEKKYKVKGTQAIKLRIIFENVLYLVQINVHPSEANKKMLNDYIHHFRLCEHTEGTI